jgi:FAD:protein FMN transferase
MDPITPGSAHFEPSPSRGEKPAAPVPNTSLVRHQAAHFAMGTIFSIIAYGSSAARLQDSTDRAFQEIDRLDRLMSHYRPDSELCTINREAARASIAASPELFALLQTCLSYSQQTNGAFDITVGPLMKLWGFFQNCGRTPARSELVETLGHIGYRHITLEPNAHAVAFDRPGIELDLGAIGKGYAVDRVVDLLRAQGVARALISSGSSSIYALGASPGEQGWEISIRHPLDSRKPARILRLRNLSISISGTQEQRFVLDGKMVGHLVDARMGMPVEKMLMTVVIAETNTAGDALSTAFFVAGPDETRAYLENHPNLTVLLYLPTSSQERVQEVQLASSINTLSADHLAAM